MDELTSILKAWSASEDAAKDAVLATVVHVKGSAYRRPGARMLLLPNGQRIGSVSGGCLESDLARKAWWLTESGRATVRVYDTTSDEDAVWEFGLGCNGVIRVLLEPFYSRSSDEALAFLAPRRACREGVVIATVTAAGPAGPQVGDRLLFDHRGVQGGALYGASNWQSLAERAAAALFHRRSETILWEGCEVFLERIGPPTPLVVFGAGHDAIPLVALAKQLGWQVTVVDHRRAYARSDRFPTADRVLVSTARDPLGGADVDADCVAVLITHNYPQDQLILEEILPRNPQYVGVLGPRVRAERMLKDLNLEEEPPFLHAPIGLDIGADTPEGISLSIVAEIQSALTDRSGGRLRLRRGPIHPRIEHRLAA